MVHAHIDRVALGSVMRKEQRLGLSLLSLDILGERSKVAVEDGSVAMRIPLFSLIAEVHVTVGSWRWSFSAGRQARAFIWDRDHPASRAPVVAWISIPAHRNLRGSTPSRARREVIDGLLLDGG